MCVCVHQGLSVYWLTSPKDSRPGLPLGRKHSKLREKACNHMCSVCVASTIYKMGIRPGRLEQTHQKTLQQDMTAMGASQHDNACMLILKFVHAFYPTIIHIV